MRRSTHGPIPALERQTPYHQRHLQVLQDERDSKVDEERRTEQDRHPVELPGTEGEAPLLTDTGLD